MSDFEKVRELLEYAWVHGGTDQRPALDRIEAEVERLREEHAAKSALIKEGWAEVDRLRVTQEELAEALEEQSIQAAGYRAEVDRLRAAGHEFFNTGDSTALGRALEGSSDDW